MRSRLTLAVLLLLSIPAFSQFTLQLTGGNVKFGGAVPPLNITVVPNGGTTGNVTSGTPCGADQTANLIGTAHFVILGTMTEFGRHWDVEFVFGAPGGSQAKLSNASALWDVTGKYQMTIRETGTTVACSKMVGASGEYQFSGPKLGGWPAKCPKPTNAPGQSPGLSDAMILRGHANLHPIFTASPTCTAALAAQWNTKIAGKGFDTVNLDYKLTY
jgi:hypothetical protein